MHQRYQRFKKQEINKAHKQSQSFHLLQIREQWEKQTVKEAKVNCIKALPRKHFPKGFFQKIKKKKRNRSFDIFERKLIPFFEHRKNKPVSQNRIRPTKQVNFECQPQKFQLQFANKIANSQLNQQHRFFSPTQKRKSLGYKQHQQDSSAKNSRRKKQQKVMFKPQPILLKKTEYYLIKQKSQKQNKPILKFGNYFKNQRKNIKSSQERLITRIRNQMEQNKNTQQFAKFFTKTRQTIQKGHHETAPVSKLRYLVKQKNQEVQRNRFHKQEKKKFDLLIADNFKPDPSYMNLDNYELGGLIGEGAYAFVRIAIHKPTNTKVAVKIYEKRRLIGLRRNLKREVKLLRAIKHENIIKLLAYFASSNHIYLIMEYGGELSLYDYLKRQKYYIMKEEEARKIYHRDIKLENILLQKDKNNELKVKIIDFGFSIWMAHDQREKIYCGTPSYMAPEILMKKPYHPGPADVWALGVLLYILLCGKFPYKGRTDRELLTRMRINDIKFPDYMSNEVKTLIRKMQVINPNQRISAAQMLMDKWCKQPPKKQPKEMPLLNQISPEEATKKVIDQNTEKETTENTNHAEIPTTKEEEKVEITNEGGDEQEQINIIHKHKTITQIETQNNKIFITNNNIIYNINVTTPPDSDQDKNQQQKQTSANTVTVKQSDKNTDKKIVSQKKDQSKLTPEKLRKSVEKIIKEVQKKIINEQNFKKRRIMTIVKREPKKQLIKEIQNATKEKRKKTRKKQNINFGKYDQETIKELVRLGYDDEYVYQKLDNPTSYITSLYFKILNKASRQKKSQKLKPNIKQKNKPFEYNFDNW